MQWIESGLENPSTSEVIGRSGGAWKQNPMPTQNRQKSNANKQNSARLYTYRSIDVFIGLMLKMTLYTVEYF